MNVLSTLLCSAISDTPVTRQYQALLDDYIDHVEPQRDIERGFFGSRGVELPHETRHDYWQLPLAERLSLASPQASAVYDANEWRGCIPALGAHAFCWRSPLSRHHGRDDLRTFFQNGLRQFLRARRADGSGLGALNHPGALCAVNARKKLAGASERDRAQRDDWSHAWTLEGLVYGMTWLGDAMDPALREEALVAFTQTSRLFAALGFTGEYGNQACVQTLGLYLYGDLLGDASLMQLADGCWDDLFDRVLDPSGQVVEQGGPCMHYSFTTVIYAWLASRFRVRDAAQRERIRSRFENCLEWFRCRMTESLYPMAGPSTRKYTATLPWLAIDLLPICEWLGQQNPAWGQWADHLLAGVRRHVWHAQPQIHPLGHGNSPFIWSILQASQRTDDPVPVAPPVAREYRRLVVDGRGGGTGFSRCRYALIRQQYQTHFNFRDCLPFAGLQTWAWRDEPPIVHPTPSHPSTTRAFGLDTAIAGASHGSVPSGESCNQPVHMMRSADNDDRVRFIRARFSWLWRFAAFTPYSTVLLDIGLNPDRQTVWTLNAHEPAAVDIGDHVVRFNDRASQLHWADGASPALVTLPDATTPNGQVEQLQFDHAARVHAFAFSDDSFHFERFDPEAGLVVFHDGSGRYELRFEPDATAVAAADWADASLDAMTRWVRLLLR